MGGDRRHGATWVWYQKHAKKRAHSSVCLAVRQWVEVALSRDVEDWKAGRVLMVYGCRFPDDRYEAVNGILRADPRGSYEGRAGLHWHLGHEPGQHDSGGGSRRTRGGAGR